ncbi:hypothetical protein Gogos_016714 [Gossypium gossypioides]|uniref:Uncharacterized protein n=1 Tax=Gossypium gossypioides TaxID=34282 RepID=A0A7J9B8M7_GOSGO|nr:hypothetical protein [Gossypium gossypioides]
MASRKQQHTTEAPINFDVNRFINLEVERLYLQMSDRSFIQEHGFDPTISAYNKIWYLVRHYCYNNFCVTPIELAVDTIVYEFYATLKDRKNHRQQGETITHVTIRGKEVLIAPHELYRFYNALYYSHDYLENIDLFTFEQLDMEGIINYLTENHGEWTHNTNIEMSESSRVSCRTIQATDKENMYNHTDVMDDGIDRHVNFQMANTLDARHRRYSESPCAKNGWIAPTPLPDMLMRFPPSGEEEDNE